MLSLYISIDVYLFDFENISSSTASGQIRIWDMWQSPIPLV
jgi:hypothetical protein